MKWEVQVSGTSVDLDDLCAVFTTDALRLKSRGTGYFLSSLQFEHFADPHQVESRARFIPNLTRKDGSAFDSLVSSVIASPAGTASPASARATVGAATATGATA